jgi:hypothetical protein
MMRSHQIIFVPNPAQPTAMRTTLDLDDDVLLAAKEHAQREKRSLGAVISDLAREALRRPQVFAGGVGASGKQIGNQIGNQIGPQTGPEARPQGGRFAMLPARDETVTLAHVRSLMDAEGV